MSGLALIAGLLGAVATWPAAPSDSSGDNARQVIREALVAVEYDSARAIMARWFGAPNAARVQARTLHDRTGEGEALPAVADARMWWAGAGGLVVIAIAAALRRRRVQRAPAHGAG